MNTTYTATTDNMGNGFGTTEYVFSTGDVLQSWTGQGSRPGSRRTTWMLNGERTNKATAESMLMAATPIK